MHFEQTIQSTQNIFGSAPNTPMAAPYTPSRRVGRHRSRTPTARRAKALPPQEQQIQTTPANLDQQQAADDPYLQQQVLQDGLKGDVQPQQNTQRTEPIASRPASLGNLSNSQAAQQQSAATQAAASTEVVDLTKEDAHEDIGQSIPQTPPGAHDPQEMEAGTLPAKRPFEAMQAGITQAQRHTDTSFELHNYQPSKPPKQGLSCWARLDLKTAYGIRSSYELSQVEENEWHKD